MGVFDYIKCEYPIDAPQTIHEWQTKDTPDQFLRTYTISKEGYLLSDGQTVDFTGEIRFYGNERINGRENYEKWWEYSAMFDNGKLLTLSLLVAPLFKEITEKQDD